MAFGDDDGVVSAERETYETFGCNVRKADPATPDRVTPDVVIKREGAETFDLVAPDGRKLRSGRSSIPAWHRPSRPIRRRRSASRRARWSTPG